MTTSREDILARLRANRHPGPELPGRWASRRQFDDLAARFSETLTDLHGEVVRVGSPAEAIDKLGDVLRDLGAKSVVANDEPPLSGADLPARWPDLTWHIVGQTPGDLRAFCAQADAGVTGADEALAETGSIVVRSGPGRSRMASLLPPVHIALVSTARLTADLFTWTAARPWLLPANMTVISGPSKTGDIELTLAYGMHGPKRLIAILYDGQPD